MGSGKTEAMLQYINSHPAQSFMVITPFLTEIERVKDRTEFAFFDPQNYGEGKLEHLNTLLCAGKNIACTHSLFLMTNEETWEYIEHGQYTLFIDEALDIVKPINDLISDPSYKIKTGSAKFLQAKGVIEVDEYGYVKWIDQQSYDEYEYKMLEQLIRGGNVFCAGGQLFLWMFPPRAFISFEDVYVLTYLFHGSLFHAYMQIHKFEYSMGSACKTDNSYHFSPYIDDSMIRQQLQSKIHVCHNKRLNDIGIKTYALSKKWYESAGQDSLDELIKHMNTYSRRSCGRKDVTSSDIMWTTFKPYRDVIAPNGYKFVCRLSADEKRLERSDPDNPKISKLRCYVPCNARATNDYSKRNVLVYLINRYYNPMLRHLFHPHGIELDNDQFALSEMLQWVWRSDIRNGNDIWIYIPSKRMRELFENWLCKSSCT